MHISVCFLKIYIYFISFVLLCNENWFFCFVLFCFVLFEMQVFPSSKVYLLDKNDVLQNPVQ